MGRTVLSRALKARAKRLARALSEQRVAAELTQAQLAERSGVSLDMVRALEQHRAGNPGVFFIVDLARALGVSVEDLAS